MGERNGDLESRIRPWARKTKAHERPGAYCFHTDERELDSRCPRPGARTSRWARLTLGDDGDADDSDNYLRLALGKATHPR